MLKENLTSCQELVDILRKRDYEEFKSRLKQLADLYKIKVDTFMKSSKIFAALEAVERDICKLSMIEGNSLDPYTVIQQGKVGYIFKREGGHLMQLSYFLTPIEAVNKQNTTSQSHSEASSMLSRSVGASVKLAVESSKVRRLPISSLAVIDDSQRIHFEALDNNNSDELPASFVMKLSKPLAISAPNLSEIHSIVTKAAADKFNHSSEASLDNLILKQHLQLKTREDWSRHPFQIMLPNKEEHIYHLAPTEMSNIGFIISRIPFSHPSQVPQIIKVLRRQSVYNALLLSCAGEKTRIRSHSRSDYFLVKATNANTIDVTFQHPVHTSMASVSFTILMDNSVKTAMNSAANSPVFCSSSYIDKVVNRCLSIPITMRSILRKASAFVPCDASSNTTSKDKQSTNKDNASRPKQLKLLIPTLSMDNTGSVPLVSPGVFSASALPTFTINSSSPSSTSFQFPVADLSGTLPGGYTKPAFSSPKKHKGSPGKSSTPGTPKSRTFKLPKITLKRKRDGDEYEIDKEKSNFDLLEESEAQTVAESLVDVTNTKFPKQETNSDNTSSITQHGKPRDFSMPTGSMSFDLSVDPMQSNSININSVGEIEGLLLGPGIDVSNLMSGNISANFDITGPSFTEGFSNIQRGNEDQVEAFDLDAITSAGSHMNFGVDDSLNNASAGAIDPSMVVSSSSTLANTPVFDVNSSFIDIDSFIMGPTTDQGATAQTSDGPSITRSDQKP